MAYEHVVAAANDGDLQHRIAAAVVSETGFDDTTDPLGWAIDNRWWFAAQPGWGDAYHSAVLSFIDRPGLRPGAITDAMILTAVQARLTELANP